VIDTVTSDQQKYYGFDGSAFAAPSSASRVLLLLSYP
jgi:hypothetical protein